MRVVPLLVIVAWFSRCQLRTLAKALPNILQMQTTGGSGNRNEKCWLKLMSLRLPHEFTVNTEALFEVVHRDGRTFDASKFKNCTLKSAVLASSPSGVLEKEQAVRLTRTISNTLQIIMNGEFIIQGDDRRYLLLSLACGESRFCIRFPGASWRATPQYLSRKFLSVESEQNQVDDYQHHAMIAMVVVAGVIILIITGAICVCGREEIASPPAKLLSLSQISLDGSRKESFEENPSNHPTLVGGAVDKNDVGNEKREEITKRQESRVSARCDDGVAENDVRSDVNGHSTEHVGNGKSRGDGGKPNEHGEDSESRKSWTRSRHSKEGRVHSSSSDEPGEGQKERSKKSKLSFLGKNKRSTPEAKGETDDVQHYIAVADRPRVPTPQPEQQPRELPPPPSITTTGQNVHERQLSAPGEKWLVCATEDEDSYEAVLPRVLVGKEFGNVRPVPSDSTCTYDTVGEGQASCRVSELYEVVDMEVRANAAGEGENDTYEVVGGDKAVNSKRGLLSADTYEEVMRQPADHPECAEVRQNLLEEGETEKNETDEVDPKYSKIRRCVKAKAENIDTDELDPKYSKVRHCMNVREGEAKSGGAKPQVKETEDVVESVGSAPVNQDQTYAEVKKDHGSPLADRPRLLKHSSTPELACDRSTPRFVSQRSDAPPAPSLNHLKEVAEASRPRASSELNHSQERRRVTKGNVVGEDTTVQRPFSADHCADDEVAQMFDYTYAKVDLTQKTRSSHEYQGTEEGSHREGNEDIDSSGEDPPPVPPIYISTPRKEEEVEVPSDAGIYDEISPSLSSSVVNKGDDVPQSTRVASTCSVDSDYETVEELMKYASNADAGRQ